MVQTFTCYNLFVISYVLYRHLNCGVANFLNLKKSIAIVRAEHYENDSKINSKFPLNLSTNDTCLSSER